MQPRLTVLSIDGGGIRGVVPLAWLKRFHDLASIEFGESAAQDRLKFDVNAGTSTGSIIAAALAIDKLSPQELIDLYRNRGAEIFPVAGRWTSWLQLLRQPLRPKYSSEGLRGVLWENFKDLLFHEVERRLIIPIYDTITSTPIILDTHDPEKMALTQFRNLTLVDACLASCSAPTYFPAHTFCATHTGLVDGGVAANNPTEIAIARALAAGHHPEDLFVVSLGTGVCEPDPTRYARGGNWGWVKWGLSIADVLMTANSRVTERVAKDLLPERNYTRIQPTLHPSHAPLDLATREQVDSLLQWVEAEAFKDEGKRQLRRAVEIFGRATRNRQETGNGPGKPQSDDRWTINSLLDRARRRCAGLMEEGASGF